MPGRLWTCVIAVQTQHEISDFDVIPNSRLRVERALQRIRAHLSRNTSVHQHVIASGLDRPVNTQSAIHSCPSGIPQDQDEIVRRREVKRDLPANRRLQPICRIRRGIGELAARVVERSRHTRHRQQTRRRADLPEGRNTDQPRTVPNDESVSSKPL